MSMPEQHPQSGSEPEMKALPAPLRSEQVEEPVWKLPTFATVYQAETYRRFQGIRNAAERAAIAREGGLVLRVVMRNGEGKAVVKDGEVEFFTLTKKAADALGRVRDSMYENEVRSNPAVLDAVTHTPAEDPSASDVSVTKKTLDKWWETPTE